MKKNLPLQKISFAGHFLLTCDLAIYGGTHTFIIDTGAMRSSVDELAALDLKLPQRGVTMPRIFTTTVEPIQGVLSDVIWYGVKMEIIVANYSALLKTQHFRDVAGVIGNDFLSAWKAVIDLPKGILTIQPVILSGRAL